MLLCGALLLVRCFGYEQPKLFGNDDLLEHHRGQFFSQVVCFPRRLDIKNVAFSILLGEVAEEGQL